MGIKTYAEMLGGVDFFDSSGSGLDQTANILLQLSLFLFTIVVIIVILNLLITVLMDSAAEVNDTAKARWCYVQAETLCDPAPHFSNVAWDYCYRHIWHRLRAMAGFTSAS